MVRNNRSIIFYVITKILGINVITVLLKNRYIIYVICELYALNYNQPAGEYTYECTIDSSIFVLIIKC